MRLLITGGAGFIGSAVVRKALQDPSMQILNYDLLTYSGNLDNLLDQEANENYEFVRGDLCDKEKLSQTIRVFQPDAIMHLAAESHVDRSIDDPSPFVHSNIVGTFTLLEVCRDYYRSLSSEKKEIFRFHHISTDEVYGSLGSEGFFTEDSSYQPNSPYSASKASSDMLVRAWHHTFGLPTLITNCSNNYGPYQFPEKLIPLMILNALEGRPLPVYGKGDNIRDWLHVDDHAEALLLVLTKGQIGEVYNIGSRNERSNLEVVHTICELVDELAAPLKGVSSRKDLISFVEDRPGHDQRYAIDPSKLEETLGWRANYDFTTGLRQTVSWYLANNTGWCERVKSGAYLRLGLASQLREHEL